jgi:hypothetical protein
MKIKIFLICALIYLAHIAAAQRFGMEGGLNISRTSGFTNGLDKNLLGIHFGPIVEFSLSERFYINSGLLYSIKGFKYDVSALVINDPYFEDPGITTHSFNYLEVPVLLVYKIPIKEGKLKLLLQGGPYFSYCIMHSPSTVKINEFDYGINLGPGIENKNIKLGLTYSIGLRDLWPDGHGRYKNRVFQISVGYFFGDKKS